MGRYAVLTSSTTVLSVVAAYGLPILPLTFQVKKLQDSQGRTQAALKRKMEEHSIAMRKVILSILHEGVNTPHHFVEPFMGLEY